MNFLFKIGRPSCCLPHSMKQPKVTFIVTRDVRQITRTWRDRLPRYKIKTQNLPPLTALLTHQDSKLNNVQALAVRQEKLLIYKKYIPANTNQNLLDAIFNPHNDADRLLKIIGDNLQTMTSFYIGISFESIDDMVRADLCSADTVLVAPEFKDLSKKALFKMRFMEADEVLKIIKCTSQLGIPENVLLVQAALQMARHLINDFEVDELDMLTACLDRMVQIEDHKKSLRLALLKALPVAKNKLLLKNQTTDSNSRLRLSQNTSDLDKTDVK